MSDAPLSTIKNKKLSTRMKCAILTNDHGEIVILHSDKITDDIEWVEFHSFENDLTIVYDTGHTQHLGIDINSAIKDNLLKAKEITLAHIDEKTIKTRISVNLIISDH
jgi:hypothetical protein